MTHFNNYLKINLNALESIRDSRSVKLKIQRYEAMLADEDSEKKEISRLGTIISHYEERLRFFEEEISRATLVITTLKLNVQAAENEVQRLNTEKKDISNMQAIFNEDEKLRAENNEQSRLLRSAYDENSRLNEALCNMQAAFNEVEKLKAERSDQNQEKNFLKVVLGLSVEC